MHAQKAMHILYRECPADWGKKRPFRVYIKKITRRHDE